MRRLKFVVVGDAGVGRTTLIESYVMGTRSTATSRPRSFMQSDTSSYNINVVVDGCPYSLKIFDPESSEEEGLEQLLRNEQPDAVIIMYDISNLTSFESVEANYRYIRGILPKVKCVLAGNKLDLRIRNPQCLPLTTLVEGEELASRLRVRYFVETSGISLRNVDELIDETVRVASPALSEINFRFSRGKSKQLCRMM